MITEHGYGTGAVPSPRDERDFQWEHIGSASTPFDWSIGFETKAPLHIKNQGQSSSCGGQATSYYGEILNGKADGAQEERSAKFIYAPVAYPNGGSVGRDLMDRAVKSGFGLESLTPSYEGGLSPSEYFMTRKEDITPSAIKQAINDRAMSYAQIGDTTNIDTIAQAIRDNNGCIIGLNGEDNGTWLSSNPQKPSRIVWRHWLFACKARLHNGIKQIGFTNSWGSNVGEQGVQWVNEDYFTSGNCFEAWTLVYNIDKPEPAFKYNFSVDLSRGMAGDEVKMLQKALRLEGLFTYPTDTGTYGIVTQDAVYKLQIKYNIAPFTRWIYKGFYFGPATRAKMNQLYNK
jgi:hypothetical protein